MYPISSTCAVCSLYMKMNWQREKISVKMQKTKRPEEETISWSRRVAPPEHKIKKMNFNIGGTRKQGGEMSLFQRLEKKVLTKAGPWVALCAEVGHERWALRRLSTQTY